MDSVGNWINSYDDFRDFISLVILYAPCDFPEEEFLRSDEQLDLEKAFNEMLRGMSFIREHIGDASKITFLSSLIDESLAAYRRGDDVKGAHLLQDFEKLAFDPGNQ